MNRQSKQIYEFGPFRLDPTERLLARDGAAIPLMPKVFDLLLALVEHHGHLLEKDELMNLVWPDTIVEEANLSNNISILRRAMDENGGGQPLIETVPKRGYRFVAAVRELKEGGEEFSMQAQPETPKAIEERPPAGAKYEMAPAHITSGADYLTGQVKRRKRRALFVLAPLIVTVAGAAYWLYQLIGQRQPGATLRQMKITRLTHLGKATRAAVSPDGKYVAYVRDDAEKQSLWLIQVATVSDEQVVPPADVGYLGVTFSRDGNFIYYVRRERDAVTGALYRKPVLGGVENKLFVNVDSPITLSPDGGRLAFVRVIQPAWDYFLIVANVDGAEEKILATRKAPDYFSLGGPAWSPDGKLIACGLRNFSGGSYASVVGVSVEDGVEQALTAQRWSVPEGRQGSISSIG